MYWCCICSKYECALIHLDAVQFWSSVFSSLIRRKDQTSSCCSTWWNCREFSPYANSHECENVSKYCYNIHVNLPMVRIRDQQSRTVFYSPMNILSNSKRHCGIFCASPNNVNYEVSKRIFPHEQANFFKWNRKIVDFWRFSKICIFCIFCIFLHNIFLRITRNVRLKARK